MLLPASLAPAWTESWRSKAGLSSFTAGVRKYSNSQETDMAPTSPTDWKEGCPCRQLGKPISQGHYVVAGVRRNQILSWSQKRKTAVSASPSSTLYASPESQGRALSQQHSFKQRNGGQRGAAATAQPQGHRQERGVLIKGGGRKSESGVLTSQNLDIMNQPTWLQMQYCLELQGTEWQRL